MELLDFVTVNQILHGSVDETEFFVLQQVKWQNQKYRLLVSRDAVLCPCMMIVDGHLVVVFWPGRSSGWSLRFSVSIIKKYIAPMDYFQFNFNTVRFVFVNVLVTYIVWCWHQNVWHPLTHKTRQLHQYNCCESILNLNTKHYFLHFNTNYPRVLSVLLEWAGHYKVSPPKVK